MGAKTHNRMLCSKRLHYRSVKPADPEITRTDETREFKKEFPGEIRVTVHHEKNCGNKPVMADIVTT